MELGQQGGGERDKSAQTTPLLIELHADKSVWINQGEYSMERIENVIYDLNPASDSPVVLAADPGVPLQRAVTVIDILQRRGLSKIALTEAEQFDE